MHARRGLVAADVDFRGVLVAAERELDILGDIHEHGPGLSRLCDIERLFDDAAEVFSLSDRHGVFADTAADAHDVHFLKSVVADEVGGDLPRKADERHAVVIGGGDTRDEVGRSRTARDEADARLARGAGVAVRRVHQTLLVTGQHDLERTLSVNGVEQVDRHAAGISEQRVHFFLAQRFDKQLCAFYVHIDIPPYFSYKKSPEHIRLCSGRLSSCYHLTSGRPPRTLPIRKLSFRYRFPDNGGKNR